MAKIDLPSGVRALCAVLPQDPGCYLFKDKKGVIIYVGKAKSLRKRVKSYFQKSDHDDKTTKLVEQIEDVSFFVTDNEVEALLLENQLIKKHKPFFNIDLKESQRYAYILRTDEPFPRMMTVKDREKAGKYFGPFISGADRNHLLEVVRSAFLVRTCKRIPKKACLRYHIGLCSAPCIGAISQEEYHENIRLAEILLRGKSIELVAILKKKMGEASETQNFEKAKIYRDRIRALDSLTTRQNIDRDNSYDEHVINYRLKDGVVYLIVFIVQKGILRSKEEFSFEYTQFFLEEFITRYYESAEVPKRIIIPHEIEDSSIVNYLVSVRKRTVTFIVPQKGALKKLLDLVERNIEVTFFAKSPLVEALKEALSLTKNPEVIECFDISHTQGTNMVGSMVQFRNGEPDKVNYRRFKIRTVIGSDDVASIYEVVSRRYARIKKERQQLPDLIVIDGGKPQLNSASEALRKCEIDVPLISLAKREEEIFLPGCSQPLCLPKTSNALKLLQQVRDEAHRFGVNYHRHLRSREMLHYSQQEKKRV